MRPKLQIVNPDHADTQDDGHADPDRNEPTTGSAIGNRTMPTLPGNPASQPNIQDLREQLVNHGEKGRIGEVSIPEVMVTKLLGIMLDFDPDLYRSDRLKAGTTECAKKLYEGFVGPMLDRHPLYAKAEVRDTGRGLHGLIWLDPVVTFESEGDRQKWAGVAKVVQRALPTDPNAPGITATTRPIGSINSKTGQPITLLKAGTPVAPDEILKLVAELETKPFTVIADLLFGSARSTCPVCSRPGTQLGVFDRVGQCYGSCGKVGVADLFDAVYAPPSIVKEGESGQAQA